MHADFKLYYRATIIQTICHSDKSRHSNQWNRIEGPELNPKLCSQLTYKKGGKYTQWGKDSLPSKWFGENWTATCCQNLTRLFSHTTYRNKLKWIKNSNIKHEILKLLEKNTSSMLFDIGLSNICFFALSSQARETKTKINRTTSNKKSFEQQRKITAKSKGHLCLVGQSCLTLCDPMDCRPPRSSVHGDSSGKNTGVCCQALLQGIFPTQGSSPGLPHCRWILYQLRHQGSPKVIYWMGKDICKWYIWYRVKIQLYKECVQVNIKQTNWLKNG